MIYFDAKEYHKICTNLNLNYPESPLIVLFFMKLYPKLNGLTVLRVASLVHNPMDQLLKMPAPV